MPAAPTPDDAPPTAASCPSCRAATAADQRYCLSCGALVGDRRLDPIEMLTADADADPRGGPPAASVSAAPRAVPLAAATAAIVVAGISGMLVTNGGSGNGARAAVVAAAPAPAPVTDAADEPAPEAPVDEPDPAPADDPLPADPLPVEELPPAADELPAEPVADDTAASDDSGAEDEDAADENAEEPTPRVWLLALEGPQAAEAVERVAKQGVRLSGMQRVAADAQANATALVGGTRPVAAAPVDPAGTPAGAAGPVGSAAPTDPAAAAPGATTTGASADPAVSPATTGPAATTTTTADGATSGGAPSLPAALKAADRTWRAYVDVHPTSGSVLPGACAAPPAGDPTASLLASRLPFAAIAKIDCETSVTGLETLGNDLSAGEDIPAFSYVAMGGCAAPERPAVALPDAVEDAVATITASTEYQQDGMLVVTTIGTQDACTPAAAAQAPAPLAPAVGAPVTPAPVAAAAPVGPAEPDAPAAALDAPTAVFRPTATAGKTVSAKLDLLALSRSMAEILGVTPPGAAGDDAVPAIALPGVPKR